MLRGLTTVSFYADDLAAARDWYTQVLGIEPYFAFPPAPQPPAYIEFRIGDDEDELGFVDRRWAPPGSTGTPGGAVVFRHVEGLEATAARRLELGATEYEPITPRGDSGFVTASVVDPFGNVLGVMTNPHFAALHS
ncbi:VOC family protein [Salana multivorans]|uniref:VOC family protein n=1 Tax=Salana multivorans TaxID=120377 RepID=UPI0024904052|nr:VOC family protein [Salana multivorans]